MAAKPLKGKPPSKLKVITVLAKDPGSTNSGIAVIRFRLHRNRLQRKVLYSGMLISTLKQLKTDAVEGDLRKYVKEMTKLIERFNPSHFIAERYMSRNIRGLSGELVNMMLGRLTAVLSFNDVPYMFIPAVTWKNAAKRQGIDLVQCYKQCATPPHEFDAAMQAHYMASLVYGTKAFEGLNTQELTASLEQATTSKLRRIRCRQ